MLALNELQKKKTLEARGLVSGIIINPAELFLRYQNNHILFTIYIFWPEFGLKQRYFALLLTENGFHLYTDENQEGLPVKTYCKY